MSYCRKEGKDEIIFLTKEDYNERSTVNLDYDKEDEEQMGLIRPDGEINWNCPCLQGMADGPCGEEFKQSFSCFHYSEADPKGSDCISQFREMQECFMRHPDVYGTDEEKRDSVENVEEEKTETVNLDSENVDVESKEEISAFSETVKEDLEMKEGNESENSSETQS